MNQDEVNIVRDAALFIEDKNLETAYELMCLAHKYRPHGQLIKNKMYEYKKKIEINNGLVNIHFGVHKTATTYIQENLELISNPIFHYTKLDEFRRLQKEMGYFKFLKSLDWSKKVVISDENMIGGNGTILTGRLYPDLKMKINKFLSPFKSRETINVYISIRRMTSFLPSQYCEYLRWNKYISYGDFTSKVRVEKLKWTDVLDEAIASNHDLKFHIFDFSHFDKKKDALLEKLSFGLMNKCDQSIRQSRASFTDKEISQLSNGDYSSDSDTKFDPHTEKEKKASMTNYKHDLVILSKFPNVTILP